MKRLQKLLIAIDWFTMQCTVHDDETGEDIIEATEKDCYDAIIAEDEDLKFLTKETIEQFIHIAFTDWKFFATLQRDFNAYA